MEGRQPNTRAFLGVAAEATHRITMAVEERNFVTEQADAETIAKTPLLQVTHGFIPTQQCQEIIDREEATTSHAEAQTHDRT